jgi:hypothetical protein
MSSKVNAGAYLISEFDMSCNEIGVEVSQDHMLDFKTMFLGIVNVNINITPGIYHGRNLSSLVGNHIRCM